jgi:hypothetical protein
MVQAFLFPESHETQIDMEIRRLDADILCLLVGRAGGPLGLTLGQDEKAVLEMIRYRRGAKNAIPLRDIQQRTKLDVRTIKQAVRTLRMDFHLPIGSSKSSESGGYYLMITADDRAIWRKDVLDQVRAQIDVLRAANGRQAALEALGQLCEELLSQADKEASNA